MDTQPSEQTIEEIASSTRTDVGNPQSTYPDRVGGFVAYQLAAIETRVQKATPAEHARFVKWLADKGLLHAGTAVNE